MIVPPMVTEKSPCCRVLLPVLLGDVNNTMSMSAITRLRSRRDISVQSVTSINPLSVAIRFTAFSGMG